MDKVLVSRLKQEYPEILFLKTLKSKGHELGYVRIIFTVDRVMYKADSFYTSCGIGKDIKSTVTFLQNYRYGLRVSDISNVHKCKDYMEAESNFCTGRNLLDYEEFLKSEAFKSLVNQCPEVMDRVLSVHFTLIPELRYVVTTSTVADNPSTDDLYNVLQVDVNGKISIVKDFRQEFTTAPISNLIM